MNSHCKGLGYRVGCGELGPFLQGGNSAGGLGTRRDVFRFL